MQPAVADTEDPWRVLKPLFRRVIKNGKLACTTRLTGSPSDYRYLGRGIVPLHVVGVIDRDGVLVDPDSYRLKPYHPSPEGWDQRCIYWRQPTMTAGLTILFESKA